MNIEDQRIKDEIKKDIEIIKERYSKQFDTIVNEYYIWLRENETKNQTTINLILEGMKLIIQPGFLRKEKYNEMNPLNKYSLNNNQINSINQGVDYKKIINKLNDTIPSDEITKQTSNKYTKKRKIITQRMYDRFKEIYITQEINKNYKI